jgi:hypothetical protein
VTLYRIPLALMSARHELNRSVNPLPRLDHSNLEIVDSARAEVETRLPQLVKLGQVTRLMNKPGIICARAKIEATLHDARLAFQLEPSSLANRLLPDLL